MAVSLSCAAAGDETLAAEIASPGLHPPVWNDNRPIRAVHDDAARLAAIDDAVRDGTFWRCGAADGGNGNDESDHRDRYANTVPMKFARDVEPPAPHPRARRRLDQKIRDFKAVF
jgi:hypothetical protein